MAKPAFDPNKPFKAEQGQKPAFDTNKPFEPAQQSGPTKRSDTGVAQSALEGFGQGATLGYLPQIQAMVAPLQDKFMEGLAKSPVAAKIMGVPQNSTVDSGDYLQRRDENIQRQQAQAKENPVAALGGQAAGIIATSVIPGRMVAQGVKASVAAKGAGLGGKLLAGGTKLAKGAAIGAVEAAALNPGDTEGEFNPLQISERIDNGKLGALFGVGGAAAAGVVKKGIEVGKDVGEKLAFKASGAMLKDFRSAAGKGKINDLGRFMLDKIYKVGDSYDDIAEKAAALKKEAGQEIGSVYKGVMKKVGQPETWQNLDPAKKSALAMTGFKPGAQKKEILEAIESTLGDSPNKKAAISFISEYVDDLSTKYGNDVDLVHSNAIKGKLDDSINYSKRAQDLPEKQEAMFALRNFIRDRIEDHIGVLDNIVGGDEVKRLRDANKLFGSASEINTIAFDRVQREQANRFFSLGDRITGGAGMAGGAVGGAVLGGDVESAIKGAALGLGGAGLSKAARTFGAGGVARVADSLSKRTGAVAVPGAVASSMSRSLLGNEYKSKEKPKPLMQPIQPEPSNMLSKSDEVAEAPKLKGPEKWANDGFEKLKIHDPAKMAKYEKMKAELMKSPRGRRILTSASDLTPGSKAMKNLFKRLEELEKEGVQ